MSNTGKTDLTVTSLEEAVRAFVAFMKRKEAEEAEPNNGETMSNRKCPDGGTCHHECGIDDRCMRMQIAGPLAPYETWDETMEPARFTKLPITIEAMPYTRETRGALIGWLKNNGVSVVHTMIGENGEQYEAENLFIPCRSGMNVCALGDYVIRGTKPDDFYPVKPDVFNTTYVPEKRA